MPDTPTLTEHELTMSRTFDAPRELVWTAWTTPEHVAQWFAPRPVAIKPGSVVIDPRPGGEFSLTMVMPDGTELPNNGSYAEFDPPQRLAFGGDVENHPRLASARTVVTFTDLGNDRTEVAVVHTMMADETMPEMARRGWTQTLEQLGEVVASL